MNLNNFTEFYVPPIAKQVAHKQRLGMRPKF